MTVGEDDTFVIHGPEPYEQISDDTVGKIVFDSLMSNTVKHDAMVDVYTGERITYKSILEESCNLAEALRAFGCSSDSVISVCSENNLQFFIPVLAAQFIGAVVAPLNHYYIEDELKHALCITKPTIVFCSEEVADKFVDLKDELTFLKVVIIIDSSEPVPGTEYLPNFVRRLLLGNKVSPHTFKPFNSDAAQKVAFVLCSSGTTGLPKGVMLTHRNMATRDAQTRDPRYATTLTNEDVLLGLMPFFHGYGLNMGLSSIIKQNKIVVMKRFEGDVFLKAIQDYKISILALAPPLAIFLAKTPELNNYDLSCVKQAFCGAAPLDKEIDAILRKRLNIKAVRQAYGLTESNLAVTIMEDNVTNKPGSSGTVITYMSVKVRDTETGKSLGPNKVGEICVKGPLVMKGYFNNEQATRESFTPDGWLRTGDLGYYDDDKYFYIVDRLKELIKYKGYQVAPAELEAILLGHPKVIDVGVVGLPDEISGELPIAFVVKDDEENVTEQELQDYVASKVSPQKRLRGGVIFVSSIPKNPSGKILRRELRASLNDHRAKLESKL
nr:luciferin 4-monooxygenase-like [Leptinotarsa decemlineata]XP_023022320.1 luciferin 4-monooxygenase-like [Leptinotarsa decemlineata]XP_023022321.1 luciferin 4-monooxygenase-like [Leptinotarsa decemlineata]